ncbi:TPA: hypothetical protein N0F65_012068 [Lagenidium giganteum]|uniref:BZIP domain-containing protein n=1 Tax=Lagenidium giganteum TaxID=4803 RepID=A0AAV2YLU3_9STRA|nr:TPA: hypothetical protein N0F65_012068 [Lagenidium giganteum]
MNPTAPATSAPAVVTPAASSMASSATTSSVTASATDALNLSEAELMNASNREMFSWLLLNSEHIAAPSMAAMAGMAPGAALSVATKQAGLHAADLNQFTGPIEDDHFGLMGTDDTPLPITLDHEAQAHVHHHQAAAAAAAAAGLVPTSSVAATLAQVQAGMVASPHAALAALNGRAAGIMMPTTNIIVPNSAIPATAAADAQGQSKRRSRKRGPLDSPNDGERPKKARTGKENKALSSTQQDLLRHLEHANDVLEQRQLNEAAGAGSDSGSVKPEQGSDSSEPLSHALRKQKLERNRESARECRRRKREHIAGVEERRRQLERENMELRGQLKAGKEAMKQEEREKNRVCEELEQMIQRGASEKELAEKIDNFKEQYSDYGHGRRSALRYHMHQIERLLLPTQVTKMCIWALRQDDSFWQDEEDETSLPVILARELGLTEEQKKRIQQQRGSITTICENLKDALGLLNELKTQVEQKNVTLDSEMDQLQNILTPTQRAKFIVWVTNNQACMHLLNKLWRSVL